MSVRMVTFPGQVRTAFDDAIVYRSASNTGILRGLTCSIGSTANTIVIADGCALIQGRLIEINSESVQIPLAPSGTLNGRIYIQADPSNSSNPAQLLYATAETLPALTQDADINDGGVYQMELCTFTVSTSEIYDLEMVQALLPTEGVKFYSDPSELLELENPTVAEMWDAMPDNSVAIVPTDKFGSASVPQSGLIKIIKVTDNCGYAVCEPCTYNGVVYKVPIGDAGGIWEEQPRFSDLFYKSGESVTLYYYGGGYITASSTSVRFLVPYSKLASRVTTATFVSGSAVIRQNGKCISGETWTLTANNVTLYKNSNGILVYLNKSSGFTGATNNSPVGVQLTIRVRFS